MIWSVKIADINSLFSVLSAKRISKYAHNVKVRTLVKGLLPLILVEVRAVEVLVQSHLVLVAQDVKESDKALNPMVQMRMELL